MKLAKFIDSVGRTILGEEVSLVDGSLKVKNPAMIAVSQQQNGQMQVQLLPLFFAEFIEASSRSSGSIWTYNVNNISLGEVDLDSKLVDQYSRIFSGVQVVAPPQAEESVIKLFDE